MIQMYIVSTSGGYILQSPSWYCISGQPAIDGWFVLIRLRGSLQLQPTKNQNSDFLALLTYLENAERFAFLPLHEVPLPGLLASVPAIRSA